MRPWSGAAPGSACYPALLSRNVRNTKKSAIAPDGIAAAKLAHIRVLNNAGEIGSRLWMRGDNGKQRGTREDYHQTDNHGDVARQVDLGPHHRSVRAVLRR